MDYLPDRLREECKTNKSFAVAHSLEGRFEKKRSTPKKKGRGYPHWIGSETFDG
jgi:hypothetical protein